MKTKLKFSVVSDMRNGPALPTTHKTKSTFPPGVTVLAAGRDHFPTAHFAALLGITPQTARKNYCLDGKCYGIRPIKLPNRRLLWSVSETAALLRSCSID